MLAGISRGGIPGGSLLATERLITLVHWSVTRRRFDYKVGMFGSMCCVRRFCNVRQDLRGRGQL